VPYEEHYDEMVVSKVWLWKGCLGPLTFLCMLFCEWIVHRWEKHLALALFST
jgi:hypothetical protein